MNKEYIFELFTDCEKLEVFGNFEFLETEAIPYIDSSFVWSSAFFDDGRHIINGVSESLAVDFYLKSSEPCNLEPFQLDVIEVYCFFCDDCDGDSDCKYCDDENLVEIDFERYSAQTKPSDRNPDTLWAFRKPYGFEYNYNSSVSDI
jgi:hypothetical protein